MMTFPAQRSTRAAPWIFTATIFLSASLLFFVQPLFAKIVLPVIGGAPSVWITAMLFFQSVLLAGYQYAHASTKFLPLKLQWAVHLAFWAAALFFLPPDVPEGWSLNASGGVAGQTLWLFALGIGVPFALLSSNAPLLQAWYAKSGGPRAEDPYFLYAASNLGSLLALMAFPLIAEPLFGAREIALGFAAGFAALGLGFMACGAMILRGPDESVQAATVSDDAAPKVQDYVLWAALAFVPSSLMLGVTSKLTTDLGAVPLLWVIPLALFLLSFVLAFGRGSVWSSEAFTKITALVTVSSMVSFAGLLGPDLVTQASVLLVAAFFVLAIWFHRRLYDLRPGAKHLTVFYVTMSVGGALGGVFNSLVGPIFFADYYEGAATLVIALAILVVALNAQAWRVMAFAAGAGIALGGLAMAGGIAPLFLVCGLLAGLALLLALPAGPSMIGALAALATVLPVWMAPNDDRLFTDRSFFGKHMVKNIDGIRIYSNGSTVHGAQRVAEVGAERPVPMSYYHPAGLMGGLLASDFVDGDDRIGIVGQGVGALACYARPGQDWHFYEIDAMVDQVARDPTLFSFLSACTPDAPTHLGDARVVLEQQEGLTFDVLVIDAYSSNAVPVHLTTKEAMALYMDRLAPGGVLMFHISSRFYDIDLPLARSAEALGLNAWSAYTSPDRSDDPGYTPSEVVMIARPEADASEALATGPWKPLQSDGGAIWTDDKANPLGILRPGAIFK